jgi:hypothetical protein
MCVEVEFLSDILIRENTGFTYSRGSVDGSSTYFQYRVNPVNLWVFICTYGYRFQNGQPNHDELFQLQVATF